jgi:tRNA G37 N-methylase Trm5
MQTKYIAGEKTKEVLYKENGCVFRFNIDSVYFSSRLSNERKEVSSFVKKGETF